MNAFVYVGSHNKSSETIAFTRDLLFAINERIPISNSIYTPANCEINQCTGCCLCFKSGKCSINDDIDLVKNAMLNSEIIILASPVYLWQVTGSMKTFVDRISSLTHLFALTGKIGISIDLSASNGNEPVSNYLNFVLESLGVSVLSNISLQHSDVFLPENKESIITVESNRIYKKISNREFSISAMQERVFLAMKTAFQRKSNSDYEKQYWLENGYFEADNFRKLFNRECTL